MTKREQIYKCEICGNIVEVIQGGKGQLICCGQLMHPQAENSTDAAREKHVPQVIRDGDKVTVRVSTTSHPMTIDHHIEWIELVTEKDIERHYLEPGREPEATFVDLGNPAVVRAYCNLHGLWVSELG